MDKKKREPGFKPGDVVQVVEPVMAYIINPPQKDEGGVEKLKMEVDAIPLVGDESLIILEISESVNTNEFVYKVLDSENEKEYLLSEYAISHYEDE